LVSVQSQGFTELVHSERRLVIVLKLYDKVQILIKAFMLGYTVRTRIAGVMYRKLFRLRSVVNLLSICEGFHADFSAAGDRAAPSGKVLNLLNNDLRRIDDVFLLASMSVQFPIFLGGTIYQIAVRFGFYPFLAVLGGIILGRVPWTRNTFIDWFMDRTVHGFLVRLESFGISSCLFGIT